MSGTGPLIVETGATTCWPDNSRMPSIAVVIPCYRAKEHVPDVIAHVEVRDIVVVDDACPDHSGAHVVAHCDEPRITRAKVP